MSETLLFFKEFFANKQTIGGIRPSSKTLAREIASATYFSKGPKNVLEIGAGTGIISEAILKNLGKDDSLTIVELNPKFAMLLNSKKVEWMQKENSPKIEVLNLDFLKFKTDTQFDVVIAGVPFNNFPLEVIEGFIQKIKLLSNKQTVFAYFEYLAARKIKDKLFREEEISIFFKKEVNPFSFKEKKIFLNVPPARVKFIRFFS